NSLAFVFQAEDGIRDRNVTGVQTCALPICGHGLSLLAPARGMPALSAKGGFSRPSLLPLTVGSQGSWDCTIVHPTEDLLLFPQMSSVGRVIAMVLDGMSSAQSQTQESPPSVPINEAALRINER